MALKDQGQFPLVNGGEFVIKIANGGTQSELFSCGNTQAGALLIPQGFVTSTLTFRSSLKGDPNALYNVKDTNGNMVSISNVAAGDHIALDPAIFAFMPFFKVIASVSQTQDCLIQVVMGPVWNN